MNLEVHINQIQECSWFERAENEELSWILTEGKMSPVFLQPEDPQMPAGLELLFIEGSEMNNVQAILEQLNEFYADLCVNHDVISEAEIADFLKNIPSLPMIISNTSAMTIEIIEAEILKAIKQL